MAVIILFVIYVSLMLPLTETVFWISFFIVLYTYAGYPLILLILVFIKELFVKRKPLSLSTPAVTMIVAAYNEEDIIEQKISNTLALNYAADKLKFIFISDGSTDNTAAIINNYPQIQHLHEPQRKGKLAAMNRAMSFVETEIVIFSDANTLLNENCISLIVSHYADTKVGGVAGEKKILSGDGVAKGEGLYWKYESFIKNLDSRFFTVVGAAGELFSIKKSLYANLPDNIIIEDFVQSLQLCGKGYVVRYEPRAYSIEHASVTERDEMERKIRIAAGGFQAIVYLRNLLNIFRYPVLSFQYISHRLLRWTLCPIALVLLFLTSALLYSTAGPAFFNVFFWVQVVCYAAAFAGWMLVRRNRPAGIFYVPFYFVFMNFCVFAGFSRYITGRQQSIWRKAGRKSEK